jgi:uncharacterized protein YcfL
MKLLFTYILLAFLIVGCSSKEEAVVVPETNDVKQYIVESRDLYGHDSDAWPQEVKDKLTRIAGY